MDEITRETMTPGQLNAWIAAIDIAIDHLPMDVDWLPLIKLKNYLWQELRRTE